MRDGQNTRWVVYRTASTQKAEGRNAVCTQAEWDEKERVGPGLNTLIRENIANEGEAERLARDLQTPPPAAMPARGRGPVPAPTPTPPA
jgi:hypothetical protein